jgi:hypothetical protein
MSSNWKQRFSRRITPQPEAVRYLDGHLLEKPEIGDQVDVELPGGVAVRATWLGSVDGEDWTLTKACRLMCDIADERGESGADPLRN